MRRITTSVLALFVVGATSCVAYDDPGYQNPPGTPPDYSSQPDPYRSAPPPAPDYRAQEPYRDDSRYGQPYPGGYDDPYRRSPSWEVGFFYEELSPYGEWVYTHDYGWAWFPRNVRAGWRPYYYGRWVPTDYGWMWVSYEPFGWATYHYGRWAWDHRLGWIWVPGRTWGPAWVSWQSGQGYIGWAPLPPEVGFQVGIGLNFGGFSLSVGIRPDHYTFIGDRYFLENEPFNYAQPVVRNTTIIQNTTNITNYTYIDNRVINKGVEFDRVERATGKRVRAMRVAESTSQKTAKVAGEEVVIYKAPRERVETVTVDDSKPRKKGERRERLESRAQTERREQQPPSSPPAREPRAEEQRRTPRAQEAPPADLEVAPRARQESKAQAEAEVSRKQQKEQQELRAYQRQEEQKLERSQREEKQKARAKAEADAIGKRHADEKKALEQGQKQEEQQLTAKQEVERKAVKAKPPGKETADEKKAREEKEKAKGKDKGKKKPQAEEPPPPHR